jgi:hypothetical protein
VRGEQTAQKGPPPSAEEQPENRRMTILIRRKCLVQRGQVGEKSAEAPIFDDFVQWE